MLDLHPIIYRACLHSRSILFSIAMMNYELTSHVRLWRCISIHEKMFHTTEHCVSENKTV
jgi:hypothetical protein